MMQILKSFTFDARLTSIFFLKRIYEDTLRQSQPFIQDSNVDAKLEMEFASWFEKYVSNNLYTLFISIITTNFSYILANAYNLSIGT